MIMENENNIENTEKQKSYTVTLLLNFFLGWLGIHRFYTGYIIIGIIQLLTLGGLGIWSFIDYIMLVTDRYKDKNNNPLAKYNKNLAVATLLIAIIVIWIIIFSAS